MQVLREFGSYEQWGIKYPRRILISSQAKSLIKKYNLNLNQILDDVQKFMEKHDIHTCFINEHYGCLSFTYTK